MLKIHKFVTMSPEQWEIVIEGMRNPMNSWDRMDSHMTFVEDPETLVQAPFEFFLGENDLDLCERLADGGPVHAKYRRMMPVWLVIEAPLYWWKEFDTYKVGTVCNSCSTMHKIHAKEFVPADLSMDHLSQTDLIPDTTFTSMTWMVDTIKILNRWRDLYLVADAKLKRKDLTDAERKHTLNQRKFFWWQMIQMLPSSYNQRRTVKVNYEVLNNIYHSRRNHKLDEWHVFCDWIEELPYSELIIGDDEVKE